MANLTNHTLLNGLEDNLKSSIEFVGGSVPEDTCIWEFPEVIKQQLTGNSIETGHVIAGDGIKVERTEKGYVISADIEPTNTAENITIDHIDAPSWAKDLDENAWEEGTTLQKILEDIFDNVLPNVPSVIKGDVIVTDDEAKDPFAPADLPEYIDALEPKTPYLRLFLASQETPIYVSLKEISRNIDLTNYYTKYEVDSVIDSKVKDAIDSLNIPEVDLSNYYTKSEVEDKIASIDIPEVDLSNHYTKEETTTIINDSINEVEQVIAVQSEAITHVTEQVNKIDQIIIEKVEDNSATEEEAIELFDSIFKN